MAAQIDVSMLSKSFQVPIKTPGLIGSLKSLFSREYKSVTAVSNVSFQIKKGEKVGFLGPNGAGKTTTLKMLTGLLHPSSGAVRINGHIPQQRPHALLKQLTLVMGQKQQLVWDLAPVESFLLNKAIFNVSDEKYNDTLAILTELLDLQEMMHQPTRQLSLGQRMRCELAAALIHAPEILFLDEPTIGLDIDAQVAVRRFINDYNERFNATIMLTSHNMDDIAQIVDRVILIHKGELLFDGDIDTLKSKFGRQRQLSVLSQADLRPLKLNQNAHTQWSFTGMPHDINQLLPQILAIDPQADIQIQDQSLEETLRTAFEQGS